LSGGVMIGLSAICCIAGYILNSSYAKKYGEPAIQWKLFVLQLICVCGALTQIPGDEISSRFLFWIAAAVLAYAAGLWKCRERAKHLGAEPADVAGAMTAQALLPVGSAFLFMMILGVVVFGFVWAH